MRSWILLGETSADQIVLETLGGAITARRAGAQGVSLKLRAPRWEWQHIPLASAADTLALDLVSGPLMSPRPSISANPHLVCFVPTRDAIDVPLWAPGLQNDPMLPEGANIGVGNSSLRTDLPGGLGAARHPHAGMRQRRLRRSAGRAATGATDARTVTVDMPGGLLHVRIHEDDSITLTGPVAVSFSGNFLSDSKVSP